jgi:hypothetical protein
MDRASSGPRTFPSRVFKASANKTEVDAEVIELLHVGHRDLHPAEFPLDPIQFRGVSLQVFA